MQILNLPNKMSVEFDYDKLLKQVKDKRILFYGASKLAKELIKKVDFSCLNIVGIIDSNLDIEGYSLHNYKIFNVKDIENIKNLNADIIILTVNNKDVVLNSPDFIKLNDILNCEIIYDVFKELKNFNNVKVIVNRSAKKAASPPEFVENFNKRLLELDSLRPRGFEIFENFWCDIGDHPEDVIPLQCSFAALHIYDKKPKNILDVGSYRDFIYGMLAFHEVTTIDVRDRKSVFENEKVITCDSKSIPLPDNLFDAVVSLCTLEHFGLGRYGDEFDIDGDIKSINEMIRVLKPGGHLIFTTNITNAKPSICFNAHRVYNHEMIKELCAGLTCIDEKAFIMKEQRTGSIKEATKISGEWDIYLGCWQK